jgi:hypothetical protein
MKKPLPIKNSNIIMKVKTREEQLDDFRNKVVEQFREYKF